MTMTDKDRSEFIAYLANCTLRQVEGVYEKEMDANRRDYAQLAADEMAKRGNVEVKFTVPDGVTVDLSEHGWLGTK